MNRDLHIAIMRKVLPGKERNFETILHEFAQQSMATPGCRGVYLLQPTPGSGSNEYGILRTFASSADLETFYRSSLYHQWLAAIAPLIQGEAHYRRMHGLEAWFRSPELCNPPEWKMALLTWIAVWPVSMVVPPAIDWMFGEKMPNFIFAGLVAAGIVILLTWVAMPLLIWVADAWLGPKTFNPLQYHENTTHSRPGPSQRQD